MPEPKRKLKVIWIREDKTTHQGYETDIGPRGWRLEFNMSGDRKREVISTRVRTKLCIKPGALKGCVFYSTSSACQPQKATRNPAMHVDES